MPKHWFLLLVLLFLASSRGVAQDPGPFKPCPVAIDRSAASAQGSTGNVWASETEPHDGLISVNYCAVYKRGKTTASRVAKDGWRELPPELMALEMYGAPRNEKLRIAELPVGYSLYNDAVFEVRTDALPDTAYLVLHLPSVKTEEEFKKLRVLHLTEDIVVPGLLKWEEMRAGPWTKSDFATRTLSAEFDLASAFRHASTVARIVVASYNADVYKTAVVDLRIGSVVGPPSVRGGDEFTYQISVVNGSVSPVVASGVVFSFSLENANFVSLSAKQGRCGRSMHSTQTFMCELDSIGPGESAEITATARARNFIRSAELPELLVWTRSEVTSREQDYEPENNRHVSSSTTIIPNPPPVKKP